jgi:hypothetical protein
MTIEQLLNEIEKEERLCERLEKLINTKFDSFQVEYPATEKNYDNHGCAWGDNSFSEKINENTYPELFDLFQNAYVNQLRNDLQKHENKLTQLRKIKSSLEKQIMI